MRPKKSFLKQKRHNLTPLLIILLLSPYILGFTNDSTNSYSEILLGAGGGQYVYHDCAGAHKQGFGDAGVYIGKKFESPFRFGLGIGGTRTTKTGLVFFPDLALDWENFSIGTTGLRFGSHQTIYFESKWFDQPPFLSGKGLIRSGIGFRMQEHDTRFWIGTNVLPYHDLGLAAQVELPLHKNNYIFFNGRIGRDKISKIGEYGISVGFRSRNF